MAGAYGRLVGGGRIRRNVYCGGMDNYVDEYEVFGGGTSIILRVETAPTMMLDFILR